MKRKLSSQEKTSIQAEAEKLHPGETITVQDDTDDDGHARFARTRIEVFEMPAGSMLPYS